jgi:hypothetical protein
MWTNNAKQYFCQMFDLISRRNFDKKKSPWCHIFLSNPRIAPQKKCRAKKILINVAIYFFEFLELIHIRNVSKQRQTIFLPNVRSNQQNKLWAKKISMMPYLQMECTGDWNAFDHISHCLTSKIQQILYIQIFTERCVILGRGWYGCKRVDDASEAYRYRNGGE